MAFPKIFDGHNDVLNKRLDLSNAESMRMFVDGADGHIDLPKAAAGGFGGGFFAVYIPSPMDLDGLVETMENPPYEIPNPAPVPFEVAIPSAMQQIALLSEMDRAGAVRICTSTADIADCLDNGPMAAILHFEGAEAIDPDFHALEVFYRAGLRSLGPVWSRNTRFAEGVPFKFPSTPDIGGGLTGEGRALVAACNRMGIMLDLSHINEAGFWDIARLSDAPLVATHSNAHAICPHARNLTDKQLAAIGESGGMVGLNFATAFLREDGAMKADVPVEQMIRHLDHMIEVMGEGCVGLGSDFDGALVPEPVADCAGLPVLQQAMLDHQYGEDLVAKISHGNWLRVLAQTWGER